MQDTAPYLAFYGLSREPFGEAVEFDLFYAEPRRSQRLDILLHLTQFSDELLLVLGPEGSGKSTLLQQFAARALDSWRVARIEAGDGLDLRDLIQQLHQQFDLGSRGATHAELLEHLQHHLDGLLRNAQQGVLLVDDAHRLSISALQRLLSLAAERSYTDRPLLRVILFAEPELQEKLAHPQLEAFGELPRRIIDLPPFDEEQTAHYILHRLSSARFVAGEPFTEGTLHKIYKQSAGWPGRINRLARQRLLDSLPKPDGPPELPGISDRDLYKPRRLIALGITLIALLALFLWTWLGNPFGDRGANPLQQQPLALPPLAETKLPASNDRRSLAAAPGTDAPVPRALGERPMAPTPDDSTAPHTAASETEPPAAAPAEQPATTAPAATSSTPLAVPATQPASPAQPAAARGESEPAKAATPSSPAPAAAPMPVKPSSPKSAALPDWLPPRRNAWLLARDPSHYTLQLVAGEHLETLQRFLHEHPLDGKSLAFYQTTRKGRPWYALVYGEFGDKTQALAARKRLPGPLRRLKPWVRNLGGIQRQLRP